jgi:hypothetical protein
MSDPKDLFPRMPVEVFDLWIRPHIPDYGWPFSPTKPSVLGTRWYKFFTRQPISYWATLYWRLDKIKIGQNSLAGDTWLRIQWVIGAVVFGQNTPTAQLEDTSKRFWACAALIKNHGDLPPIIGVATNAGFSVVDGHHRLAALVHLGMADGHPISAWIGSPKRES